MRGSCREGTVSTLLKIATAVWKHTPSRTLREKYLAAYCWVIRGRRVITTIDGVTFELDLSEVMDVAVKLRRFEPEVVEAIKSHTRAGDIVLDIGANAGFHALAFAMQAQPGGKVYAFEPTNQAYARLRENIRLNPKLNVEPIQVALSDRNLPSQTVDFRSSWRTDGIVEQRLSTVSFFKLDDWIRDKDIDSVSIMKIDVDGYEYPVIRGGLETITRFLPTIFIEVGLWHFDDPTRDPFDLLGSIGYRFWDAKSKQQYSHEALKSHISNLSRRMVGISINVIASARKEFVP